MRKLAAIVFIQIYFLYNKSNYLTQNVKYNTSLPGVKCIFKVFNLPVFPLF